MKDEMRRNLNNPLSEKVAASVPYDMLNNLYADHICSTCAPEECTVGNCLCKTISKQVFQKMIESEPIQPMWNPHLNAPCGGIIFDKESRTMAKEVLFSDTGFTTTIPPEAEDAFD